MKNLGIITDEEFGTLHEPPFPKPSFLAFENPDRVKFILEFLERKGIFKDERITRVAPEKAEESILTLAHSKYHVNSIKKLSEKGGGIVGDENFVDRDTYHLASKAVGGAIRAVEGILEGEFDHSLALIRPPGHHAIRDKASGLCIFNNIATAILYLRKVKRYRKKIAIVDIDDHFGDGVCQYFYEDPSVLYCSIHEFDFIEWDVGDVDEVGEDEAVGTNVNFPIPPGIIDENFLEFFDVIDPILHQFGPDLVIVATGFDMYFDDPIGSSLLTSKAYYEGAKRLLELSNETCGGKLAFILEGGYSLTGMPYCVHSMIKALLGEEYERPESEYKDFSPQSKRIQVNNMKAALKKALSPYWSFDDATSNT
jgi:acetoin utilization deacetylase AcuC-like enzyme